MKVTFYFLATCSGKLKGVLGAAKEGWLITAFEKELEWGFKLVANLRGS